MLLSDTSLLLLIIFVLVKLSFL